MKEGKEEKEEYPETIHMDCLKFGNEIQLVVNELKQAIANWPSMNSAHEGLGLIEEELDELKKIIFLKQKLRDLNKMRDEAIQLAAMAVRFAFEVCNEEVGRR